MAGPDAYPRRPITAIGTKYHLVDFGARIYILIKGVPMQNFEHISTEVVEDHGVVVRRKIVIAFEQGVTVDVWIDRCFAPVIMDKAWREGDVLLLEFWKVVNVREAEVVSLNGR